jgi:hypothetical protein
MSSSAVVNSLLPRISRLIGAEVTSVRIPVGGYTPALRLVCTTARGSVFVKAGSTPLTAGFIRREIAFYRKATGSFLPTYLADDDHELHPLLLLEDLSKASWPPPWNASAVGHVLSGIRAFHAAPFDVPSYAEAIAQEYGWREVASDPRSFLSLGLVTGAWLDGVLPKLLSAEVACVTEGNALCHFDIRSDNLCFVEDRAIFIDWNCVCRGNPSLDIGFWLPSLASENGPRPETILPDAPEVAAFVSGYFAARAGQPMIPDAPHVRTVQRRQLVTALPWVVRALGLPMPAPAMHL